MTDQAVIPAAPVDPAAPAASVVPDPAALAAAVAPAPAAAPAAPVVAAPAASLVDDPAAPAAPAAPAEPSLVPAEPAPIPKWYLSEGVGGEGDAPDWFKADKYKTVDAQAKAYNDLEGRFGAFTGAPEDGVYKINMPEGVVGEFDTEHQLFQDLNKWASASQLSQVAYDDVIGMLSRYEASMVPDMGEIKKELGDNADARILSVAQWAKSNLTSEEYNEFRNAQKGSNAASVFKAMEAVIGKTRQVAMPRADDDVSGATATGLEEINAMQAKVGEDGRRLYETDSKYREMVEKKRFDYFKAQASAA